HRVGPALALHLLPRAAAVARPVQAASRAAAGEAPRRPVRLPERREQDVRVAGIHGQVDRPGLVVLEEDLLPALAAVPGTEDAALRARTVRVAQGRDVDEVRVLRVDDESGDLAGVLEPDARPRLPRVGGLVDAVAVG